VKTLRAALICRSYLMGHANVDTTLNVYTQVLDGSLRQAVENERLRRSRAKVKGQTSKARKQPQLTERHGHLCPLTFDLGVVRPAGLHPLSP